MTAAESASSPLRTVGIEEEMLLVDRETGHLVGVSDELTDEPTDDVSDWPSIEHEFKRQQIETATEPSRRVAALRTEVLAARQSVADRALPMGVSPVALATHPGRGHSRVTPDERYGRMMAAFGTVATTSLACGMHVHVSVASRDEGVGVIDRIRGWLPVLLAMSANSPYFQGRDTGYASYRSVSWSMWPTAGPTDLFGDAATYDAEVERLVATGAALDEAMIYFDARLSAQYPTVEIRVMDICPTVDVAVPLAALCRGLVETAAREWADGTAAPDVSRSVLRAATWRAGRFGLTEELVHPASGRLAPAPDVVAALVEHVRDALAPGDDLDVVTGGVARLLRAGTGAERQRAAYERRHRLSDIVDGAREWTLHSSARTVP